MNQLDSNLPTFNLRLFGAPEVRLGDVAQPGLAGKPLALLSYLAVTQQAQRRALLAPLLWGEVAEANARANLRKAVQQLRSAIPDYLDVEAQTLRLSPRSPVVVDVLRFESHLFEFHHSKDPNELEAAVALYAGDFMAGFFVRSAPDFEEWMLAQQRRLRTSMLDALGTLSRHRSDANQLPAAIAAVRRIVELEPWNEEAHAQLMELLARSGDRSAALRQFDELQQRLLDEFDDDSVSDATKQLYAHVVKRQIEVQPAPPESPPPIVPSEAPVLPLESPPEPGLLPAGSIMPLSRNPLFVGRTQDLGNLAQALSAGGAAAVSQVETAAATGLGGIGKTQLACEFVHRYGRYFPGGVFWLSFDSAEAIPAEIAACGGPGALELRADFSQRPLADQVRLVQSAWQEPTPRLLVFDNCEALELLTRWRPTSGGCRVIVTSRRGDWEPTLGVRTLALGVLSRAESRQLLLSYCPGTDVELLNAIADEVGDLPLALHLAGSYLRRYPHVQVRDYLEQLRDPDLLQHPSMQGAVFSPTGHMQHVGRTFALSYDRLDPADETDMRARRLLVHAAHFAPGEPIWSRLLVKTLGLDLDRAEDATKADAAFARLVELGIIETEADDILRMHRLVARFVRDVARSDVAASQQAVEAVVFGETTQMNLQVRPVPLLAWQLHLRSVVDIARVRSDAESARLCRELATHLWQIGDFDGALPYARKSLAIFESVQHATPLDVAESLTLVGRILRAQMKPVQTRPLFERALELRLRCLETPQAQLAEALDNLGRCLDELGQPAQALPLLERALKIVQELASDERALAAEYQNNVGYCLYRLGRLEDALGYFMQALAINSERLGPAHAHTGLSHHNLGALLQRLGQMDDAHLHLEAAVAIRRDALGDEHHETAQSLNALGELLRIRGRHSEARTAIEQALDIYKRSLGEQHVSTSSCLRNLGRLCLALGEKEQALSHLQRAYVIRRELLGAQHKETLSVCEELHSLGQPIYPDGL